MVTDEDILQAMRKTKIVGKADLSDFLDYNFVDAKSLGVRTSLPDRWHWHSDIRKDELEDMEFAILKPVLETVKKLLQQESQK